MECARLIERAGVAEVDELLHLLRDDVRRHADHADRADGHHGHGERVVAAEDRDVAKVEDLGHAVDGAAGFLHARHIVVFREARDGFGRDGDAGTSGHVVDHDRDVAGIRDGGEVAVQALLRGLVVVRGDLEREIRAVGLRVAGQVERLGGRVRAASGKHLAASVHELDHGRDHAFVFLEAQRGRFAGGADRGDPVDTVADLHFDQLRQFIVIHCSVAERSHKRRVETLNFHI